MAVHINIDNGGTLTDICIMTDGVVKKTKVLTTPYDLSKGSADQSHPSGIFCPESHVCEIRVFMTSNFAQFSPRNH
jgi:N-methylhydantoinase A